MSVVSLSLPPSPPGTLIVLVALASEGSLRGDVHIARSFDGHHWEGVMPTPAEIDCNAGGSCTARYSSSIVTRIDTYVTPSADPSSSWSRFLMQASFGPTRQAIQEMRTLSYTSGDVFDNWL